MYNIENNTIAFVLYPRSIYADEESAPQRLQDRVDRRTCTEHQGYRRERVIRAVWPYHSCTDEHARILSYPIL